MHTDILIIGAGAGGSALALGLAPTGKRILMVERGGFLPREAANWDAERVFGPERLYNTDETWTDARDGSAFRPSMYYHVGGNTKVYGAALVRFRERDFEAVETPDGLSPAWPIRCADLAPYYDRVERLYHVHGERGSDPTEPPASGPYPHPPLPHEPRIAEMVEALQGQGLRPFPHPIGLKLNAEGNDAGPHLLRELYAAAHGDRFDGFPDPLHLKADAETATVLPAISQENVWLKTGVRVRRLLTDASGSRVTGVEADTEDGPLTITADLVVLAAGAVNSAALLLASRSEAHPDGLANGSGRLGRGLMRHVTSKFYAVDPKRPNDSVFQKTVGVNDFYHEGLGHLHLMGKHDGPMIARDLGISAAEADAIARHSVDWWVQSEDLPHEDSRVTLTPEGGIRIAYRETNRAAHARLMDAMEARLRAVGFEVFYRVPMPLGVLNHQCGTCRMGTDPATSVLDVHCRTHEVENLYVVDASFLPSSGASNPTMTIAANALRVAEHLAAEVV